MNLTFRKEGICY